MTGEGMFKEKVRRLKNFTKMDTYRREKPMGNCTSLIISDGQTTQGRSRGSKS